MTTRPGESFRQATPPLGLKIDVTNVADALELLDEPPNESDEPSNVGSPGLMGPKHETPTRHVQVK